MPDIVGTSFSQMSLIRQKSSAVLVSFSGGKDSLVLLNLAQQVFKKIECFFMYYVPGIEMVENNIDAAEQRYGIKVHRVQHWAYYGAKKYGVYCSPNVNVQLKRLGDVYEEIRARTGIVPILTGAKRDDGQWRRTNTETLGAGQYADVYTPIYEWTTYDVVGYCKMRGIQLPKSENKKNTGVDLSTKFVLWAYENDRQAYEKLKEEFPLLDAMVYREYWYNVTGKNVIREVHDTRA